MVFLAPAPATGTDRLFEALAVLGSLGDFDGLEEAEDFANKLLIRAIGDCCENCPRLCREFTETVIGAQPIVIGS